MKTIALEAHFNASSDREIVLAVTHVNQSATERTTLSSELSVFISPDTSRFCETSLQGDMMRIVPSTISVLYADCTPGTILVHAKRLNIVPLIAIEKPKPSKIST